MKALHLFITLILFLISLNTSLALMSVGIITKERAKELGIEVRAKPGGPDHAWVELEFKPEGKLERFRHVSLEIADKDQLELGWTPLKDQRTSQGTVLVRVMGSRAFLKRVTLRIVLGDIGRVGNDIRLKDFINFDTLDQRVPSNPSENIKPSNSELPAAAAEIEPQ